MRKTVLSTVAAIALATPALAADMKVKAVPPPPPSSPWDVAFGAGLTSDYVFSSTHIVINRGDTLTIHFYNPTDQTHSFTMESPYSNDVVVQPASNTTISTQTIVLTAGAVGIFTFHCKFHPPQMMGVIVVQQ